MNFMNGCASVYGKMTPENSRKLWKIIQEAGDYLGD